MKTMMKAWNKPKLEKMVCKMTQASIADAPGDGAGGFGSGGPA